MYKYQWKCIYFIKSERLRPWVSDDALMAGQTGMRDLEDWDLIMSSEENRDPKYRIMN